MIEIDGSVGGGQLLRTAVSLATLLGESIKITDIRKGKKDCKSGLRPQHLVGVKTAGEFSDAEIKGLEVGSTEVEFYPRKLDIRSRQINIGTAGSVALLLQALTPILIFGKKPVTLEIIGGTENKWAPTLDYVRHVKNSLLGKMGADLNIQVVKRGFYPKGGGRVKIESKPVRKLRPLTITERGEIKNVNINSLCGRLPKHIVERQAEAALAIIKHHFPIVKTNITQEQVITLSAGTSITCWATCEDTILGGSALGELGIKAEVVGQAAAEELVMSLKSKAGLDKYMADQILPYLALASGKSKVAVEEITDHCRTNIQVIERLLPVKFEIDEAEKLISVHGTGFG